MGKIFISHSSVNNAEALAIDDWLHEQGWADTFLDLDPRRGLVAGERWQAALKSAAESCELILVVISPDWAASRWCIAEFLLAKQMNKQILGVVVQPTPYETLPPELTTEWQLVDLHAGATGWTKTIGPPRLPTNTVVSFAESGLARLAAGLQKAGLDPSHFPWPPAGDPDRAPYRGLLPLDADDAGIFFGRDGMIVLTLDALRGLRAKAAPRFATILGASGAGKSSFLRAGILPRLQRDSTHFHVLPVVRPERAALTGEHGLAAALLRALASRNITRNRAEIRNAVLAGAGVVAPLLRQIIAPVDAGSAPETPPTLVLAVDQAEELLEPGGSAAEGTQFLTLLTELAKRDDPALIVIFTIRSDGFGRLQDRPELEGTKPHLLVDLSPMPAGAFGDVIRGPARRLVMGGRKLELEEPLVDALLEDIQKGGGKDALPLLAFTMERLFHDYGSDGDLKLSEYQDLGRIRGAIEAAVEQALASADGNPAIPRDRAERLRLLRRGLIPWLAGIDPDTKSPRRRVARLSEVPDEARALIELMVAQRLLSQDIDSESGETTIEPAHEALLRQWGALDDWLVEDSADLALLEAVRRAAGEWAANARSPEFLAHKGARLGAAEAVAAQEKFARYLAAGDRDYLAAARGAEEADLRATRAERTRATAAAAVAAVILIVGGIVSYFVWSAGEAAKIQAGVNFALAQSESALRGGDAETATRYALDAFALQPNGATRTAALAAAMSVSPYAAGRFEIGVRSIDAAWADDDHIEILGAGGARTSVTLSARTAMPQPALATAPNPVAVRSGAEGVFVLRADGSIARLDGTIVAAPPAEEFAVLPINISASGDGDLVLFRGLTGDVLVRDCRALPCTDAVIADNQVSATAVAPDGARYAILRNGHFLDIHSSPTTVESTIDIPLDDFDSVLGADWSPRGDLLAIITRAEVHIVRTTNGAVIPFSIESRSEQALGVWSPSEDLFASPCNRQEICIYDALGREVQRLLGHISDISMLRWSPDGAHLVSGTVTGAVRFWSMTANPAIVSAMASSGAGALTALAIDRDRDIVAAGDDLGIVHLWRDGRVDQLQPSWDIETPGGGRRITSLAFLADGRLAAVEENSSIGVWSVDDVHPQRVITRDNASFSRIASLTGAVRAVVPLTDGRIVTLSGDDLNDADLPPDIVKLTPWGVAGATADNAGYVSHSDGSIRLRDFGSGADAATVFDASQSICGSAPTTDNNGAKSLDVSDDGKWLAATRTDARVIVHNLSDPARPLCMELLAPDSKTVAFSPDSRRLAVLSATDRLYLFNLADPANALILGTLAVPELSGLARTAANNARVTSWLDWRDDATLAIATNAGIELVNLDPAAWRARVDSLFFTQ